MKPNKTFNPFKNLKLDKYEQEIENALKDRKIKIKPASPAFKKKLTATAKATLKKNKNINLRVNTQTYLGLKQKAAELGLPYQTLASSILHQYASL